MKSKNTAAILAILVGFLGIHQFYLGNVVLGLGFIFLAKWRFKFAFILAVIQGVRYLTMSQEEFEYKYTKGFRRFQKKWQKNNNQQSPQNADNQRTTQSTETTVPTESTPNWTNWATQSNNSTLKSEGIKKYKEYDFRGAIVNFEKVILTEPNDNTTLFNLACCYSILEEKEKAFHFLSRAVAAGMKDTDKIMKHDGLAHLRVQLEWDDFVAHKFKVAEPVLVG